MEPKPETNPPTKGESDMEKELQELRTQLAAMQERFSALSAQMSEVSKRPAVSPDEFRAMQDKVAAFDALSTEMKNVKTELNGTRQAQAATEVATLLDGVPKSTYTEDTKQALVTLAMTDRKQFDAMAMPFIAAKKGAKVFLKEYTAPNGNVEVEIADENKQGYIAGKSDIDNKIAVRTFELIDLAKKDGKVLDFKDAGVQAWKEVTTEEEGTV